MRSLISQNLFSNLTIERSSLLSSFSLFAKNLFFYYMSFYQQDYIWWFFAVSYYLVKHTLYISCMRNYIRSTLEMPNISIVRGGIFMLSNSADRMC